jgi:MSHA biogenesis protein MshJ
VHPILKVRTFDQLMANFSALQLRERVIAVAVGAIVLVLIGNLVLLKPVQLEIDRLRTLDKTHKSELDVALKELADIDGILSTGADPLAIERAERDGFLRQIAEADSFYAQQDAKGPQIQSLASSILEETPGVDLISLRTIPAEVFYAPPAAKAVANTAVKAVEDISKLLTGKDTSVAVNAAPVVFQKTLYKHAVEVSVRGSYADLLLYMEKLQKYPKRVFWSEARLTASTYSITVLRLTIFVITDSPIAALS